MNSPPPQVFEYTHILNAKPKSIVYRIKYNILSAVYIKYKIVYDKYTCLSYNIVLYYFRQNYRVRELIYFRSYYDLAPVRSFPGWARRHEGRYWRLDGFRYYFYLHIYNYVYNVHHDDTMTSSRPPPNRTNTSRRRDERRSGRDRRNATYV